MTGAQVSSDPRLRAVFISKLEHAVLVTALLAGNLFAAVQDAGDSNHCSACALEYYYAIGEHLLIRVLRKPGNNSVSGYHHLRKRAQKTKQAWCRLRKLRQPV